MPARQRQIPRAMRPGTVVALLLAGNMPLLAETPETETEAAELPPVVTTTTRAERLLDDQPTQVSRVPARDIERVSATHFNEIMHRVPGAWVTRNSGQEHLTAIRSPVLTGPGACGAFLFLEDGIPVRAPGFCNVNGLFELNAEQAGGIEVVRGPGNALYGSNALHGMINVVTREPDEGPRGQVFAELGPEGYYRSGGSLADRDQQRWRISGHVTEDKGWRDDAGFSQQKLNARYHSELAEGQLEWLFAATNLDQDTAGFIEGRNAYRDAERRRSNENPEAFRKNDSQRLAARWTRELDGDTELQVTPHLRRQDMEFLMHFLPGQPLETNGQIGLGLLSALSHRTDAGGHWTTGIDLDYSEAFLAQSQDEDGPPPDRPEGAHYDYEVDAVSAAAFGQYEHPLGDATRLEFGARLEYVDYDYRNNLEPGNLREDGEPCETEGGCLYTRPEDRSDNFTTLTPHLGLIHRIRDEISLFGRVARGYRAPQATELYRLQSGQEVSDLDTEQMDSVEVGVRGFHGPIRYEAVAWYMEKDNFIFQDADGFNVSDGQTRHRGLDLDASWRIDEQWRLAANLGIARHSWAFNRDLGAETIVSGREIPAAPRYLGSTRIEYRPRAGTELELEWIHQARHYLDAENEHRYGGHNLLALRLDQELAEHWSLGARVNNLTNRAFAERADFAFGDYRYFPGRGRSLFADIEYRF